MNAATFFHSLDPVDREEELQAVEPPRLGVVEAIRRLVAAADADDAWEWFPKRRVLALPQAKGFGAWLPRAIEPAARLPPGERVEFLVRAWMAHREWQRRAEYDRAVGAPVGTTAFFGRRVAPELARVLASLRRAYPDACAQVLWAPGCPGGVWTAGMGDLRPLWLKSGCCLPRFERRLALVLREVDRGWEPRRHTYTGGVHWAEALEDFGYSGPCRRWEEWFLGTTLLGERAPSRIRQIAGRLRLRGAHCTAWALAAWWKREAPGLGLFETRGVADIPWEKIRQAARLLPAHQGPGMAKAARAAFVWGWMGSIPRTPAVRDLDPALVQGLRESTVARRCFFRLLQQVLPTCPEDRQRDTVDALARAVVSWSGDRNRAVVWLGGDLANHHAVHDRGSVCSTSAWPAEAAAWAWAHRAATDWASVARVANAHASWAEVGVTSKTGVAAAAAALASLGYASVRVPAFAQEAARWGVSPDHYPALEARWVAALQVKREGVPRIRVSHAGIEARVLDRDDPRALFAGEHTGCCQHPGGAGEEAAWASVKNPDSSVLVFEKHGEILRQAWVWRGRARPDVLVLDSLEGFKGGSKDIETLLFAVAREWVGLWGIQRVELGTSYGYHPSLVCPPGIGAATAGCPAFYTDARSTKLLAEAAP